MSRSRVFMFSMIGFIGGCVARDLLPFSYAEIVIGGTYIFGAGALCPRRTRFLAVIVISFLLGMMRVHTLPVPVSLPDLHAYEGREVVGEGVVDRVYYSEAGNPTYVLVRGSLALPGGKSSPVFDFSEMVSVHGFRFPAAREGGRIRVVGELAGFPASSSRALTTESVQAWNIRNPSRLDSREIDGMSRAVQYLYDIRERGEQAIHHLFPEPSSALLAGILLGSRGQLSRELTSALITTGTIHIVALSGYNITILASMITILLSRFLSRRATLVCAGASIALFVIMTGANAATVRAGIMGTLALIASLCDRLPRSLNALLAAAAAMIFIEPATMPFDIGFQLSVAATTGLLLLSDRFEEWFRFLPNAGNIRSSFATTIAAQIATLPILLFSFGRISFIAPLVNLTVLPLIPLVMALGFIAVMVALVVPALGSVAALPSLILLTALQKIIRWCAELPFAATTIPASFTHISALVAGFVAIIIFIIAYRTRYPYARA